MFEICTAGLNCRAGCATRTRNILGNRTKKAIRSKIKNKQNRMQRRQKYNYWEFKMLFLVHLIFKLRIIICKNGEEINCIRMLPNLNKIYGAQLLFIHLQLLPDMQFIFSPCGHQTKQAEVDQNYLAMKIFASCVILFFCVNTGELIDYIGIAQL